MGRVRRGHAAPLKQQHNNKENAACSPCPLPTSRVLVWVQPPLQAPVLRLQLRRVQIILGLLPARGRQEKGVRGWGMGALSSPGRGRGMCRHVAGPRMRHVRARGVRGKPTPPGRASPPLTCRTLGSIGSPCWRAAPSRTRGRRRGRAPPARARTASRCARRAARWARARAPPCAAQRRCCRCRARLPAAGGALLLLLRLLGVPLMLLLAWMLPSRMEARQQQSCSSRRRRRSALPPAVAATPSCCCCKRPPRHP